MRLIGVMTTIVFISCNGNKAQTTDTKLDSAVVDSIMWVVDTPSVGKQYHRDEMYDKYINASLLDFLDKNFPTWSIPNQNMWYPQLFKKYSADSTLVNYATGDFNCDSIKDYALLLDKGNNMLAVVAFLRKGDSFETKELTEFPYRNKERIEDHIEIFPPGDYYTADPDLEPKDRKVRLLCKAIGVGPFKELFEGGKDVFYWDNKELRSCSIVN